MNEKFDFQKYLSKGVEDLMRDVVKATMTNPRESAFMLKFAAAAAAASKKRELSENAGEHVQPAVVPA